MYPNMKNASLDEELKDMYFWHGLPENWQDMDYLEFLAERRQRIAKVIQGRHLNTL